MKNLISNFRITVHDKLYVKDPETSDLGKKIIQHSILLIDEIGFELFTFKKLGERIQSNESSIYRYFENKHKLLLYLSSWYWAWMEYNIVFTTTNLQNPVEKLEKAIEIITQNVSDDLSTPHINEAILNHIIVSEFTKTFLTKEVDEENKEGFFIVYKRVILRIVEIIQEVNPAYKYARTLATTIIEGGLHQQFVKKHFKTITDFNPTDNISEFYIDLAKNTLL
ncbi:TetR/AcrR family transcriptional regulator [Flavobacterium sp.]|uniref:TetR/AcrR family transcriptional regulator n=1 Tax=Flavobacterium sp. TaxID=239 RepID=UPI003D13D711